MELVCDAICAGAFKSPEWIKFKTRLATDPSFQNVVKFLEMDAPQPYTPIVGNPKDDGTWVLTCNIDRFADEMEAIAMPNNTVDPLSSAVKREQKKGLRRGRPSPRDERLRIEILSRWDQAKGARQSQKVFCEDNGITVPFLEKIINWRTTRNRRKK